MNFLLFGFIPLYFSLFLDPRFMKVVGFCGGRWKVGYVWQCED